MGSQQSTCITFELHVTGGELICDQKETLELKYFALEEAPEMGCKQHAAMLQDIKDGQYGMVR